MSYTINTELLEIIENEIMENNQPTYQRIIPISEYTFETKRTLDILVEKYGGFINRYDDKIIIFINYSVSKYKKSDAKEAENTTKAFDNINNIIKRLDTIEDKINKIIDDQNRMMKEANKSVYSYLNYFTPNDDKKGFTKLVDEIINHHN